jgi:2',3'-cyclic-nucleotide 2'-phosphodiesterase (5'-nucleotidase family)
VATSPANPTDFAALAAIIQQRVDALRGAGINRIILLAHMQQWQIEADELAPRLDGVDVIIAGGSHAVFADGNDRLRTGDAAAATYPLWRTSSVGEQVAVLQAGANWRYVGRLVATFDDLGRILPASVTQVSGVYATDAQGVADLAAGGLIDANVQTLASGLGGIVNAKDGELYGRTAVFLNGLRASVRTEETNLGNLSADANLAAGRAVDASAVIALKNGGGIRDAIGTVGTGATPSYLPPAANPTAGKPEGAISRLDIENSLRFNNSLVMLTVTAAQLKELLEHSVAASSAGQTPGQFPQVGGLRFAWNPAGTAQVLAGGTYAVTTPGTRIQTVVVNDASGTPADVVVSGGAVVGDPARTFRLVTLNFLENGGDGYPFPKFRTENPTRYQLVDLSAGAPAGFSVTGFEQDAFADHLLASYPLSGAGYQAADTPVAGDLRVQNVAVRAATQFAPLASAGAITTAEDASTTGTITLSDPDTAAAALTVTTTVADPTLLSAAVSGTTASRTLAITPAANRHGATTIQVTVSDGTESTTTTVAVTVTPVNDAPTAADAAFTTAAGSAVSGTLGASDADGDALTFRAITAPTRGAVTVAANGAFTYTPAAGASGADTFTFRANDGVLDSGLGTVTVTITAAGTPGGGGGAPGATAGGGDNNNNNCGAGGISAAGLLLMAGLLFMQRRRR